MFIVCSLYICLYDPNVCSTVEYDASISNAIRRAAEGPRDDQHGPVLTYDQPRGDSEDVQ